MKKHRLISVLFAVAMLFSVAACGETAQDGPASQLPASQAPTSSAPETAADDFMLAMGNADVPVGQYTQKIFAYYDLSEDSPAVANKITYGSNVKEVTTQISEGTVSCGIIYQTDAYSAGLTVVDTATKKMCGQVIYPAAVMNVSRHPEDAQAFLDYLTGAEAAQIFEKVGFTPISNAPGQPAQPTGESAELIIFAAASMKETLTEISELYQEAAPNVTLVFTFDSSGTLKTQIENGADVDLFISAAPKQMNQLDSASSADDNPDGLDFVLQGTRIDLLENKVALAVPDGNPAGINSYDDLAARLSN